MLCSEFYQDMLKVDIPFNVFCEMHGVKLIESVHVLGVNGNSIMFLIMSVLTVSPEITMQTLVSSIHSSY